jgi:RNA polymerase sporulation-specific sigma factor
MDRRTQTDQPDSMAIQNLELDNLLVHAAREGDANAFDALFRRYRPRVFSMARRYYVPGADRDDLLQEGTLGFFKAVRDFKEDRGTFLAFAELCVIRQLITFVKSSTRKKHAILNRAVSLDAPAFDGSRETVIERVAASPENIPLPDTSNADFIDALRQCCSVLERSVLSMYAGGYSFDEMARELGVHAKSIDNAVWRIKVKAKKLLAEKPVLLS